MLYIYWKNKYDLELLLRSLFKLENTPDNFCTKVLLLALQYSKFYV